MDAVGCKAGDNCRFLHPSIPQPDATLEPLEDERPSPLVSTQDEPRQVSQQVEADRTRVVSRPTPKAQTEDPGKFQIGQVQRRYRAEVSEHDGTTTLSFKLEPSDPDFPYEIKELECVLAVPTTYPNSGRPTLSIRNKEIPRGFQINIERGFNSIAAEAPGVTLLGLMNRLDQRLETILSGRKAETITIVSNKASVQQPSPIPLPDRSVRQTHSPPVAPKDAITAQQKIDAQAKRQADVRQLEARFGRLQSYAKSADGLKYTLPLESPKRSTWPSALQSLHTVQLKVPGSYPLDPPELSLGADSAEARVAEVTFREHARENQRSTLTQHINHVSQHLREMATPSPAPAREQIPTAEASPTSNESSIKQLVDDEKGSHVVHIPRPPEWDAAQASDDSSEDDSSKYDTGEDDEVDDDDDDIPQSSEQAERSAPVERGVLLSFPNLELHGIELLQLTSLNVTVKCERCKDIRDIERLRSATESSKAREDSCKKCATGFAVRFRPDMIHANSVRGGYLDLDGCTVVDMLPSNFTPTCSECSTAYPDPGVVAVRGDSALAICRECHKKMTFRIQEVKFLQISASTIRASRAPGKKKTKENLGITAGTELPDAMTKPNSIRPNMPIVCSVAFARESKITDQKTAEYAMPLLHASVVADFGREEREQGTLRG
ncbi:hypothetical protein LTR37_009605 [Vermiconidia calcicola]|uniref:Uncharacterized protein n=1 Tax=Vermiconidia calcicola TaxID=1690605 RepID=A0ACC3N8U5_9PEZI|nr:hypothetical protein LTR37_009605 [Vermiconidia calcicola]